MGFLTKHHIMLKQARGIQYDFVINRKLTIIRGDSATAKSTLIQLLQNYEMDKQSIALQCDCRCVVLPTVGWDALLENIQETIFFLDESLLREYKDYDDFRQLGRYVTEDQEAGLEYYKAVSQYLSRSIQPIQC